MQAILDLATLLGGIAAVWFFWQQLTNFRRDRAVKNSRGEQRTPEKSEHHANKPLIRSQRKADTSPRQALLDDIYNYDLRTSYLASRDTDLEHKDRQRAFGTRLVFAITVGLIVWTVFYTLFLLVNDFLAGVRKDILLIPAWALPAATSGVIYGLVCEVLQYPPHYKSEEIYKDVKGFWLFSLLWAGGVGTLGYLTGYVLLMTGLDNGLMRFLFLVIWLAGYIFAGVVSFGPHGSVYSFEGDLPNVISYGPLPYKMYIFCKSRLSVYEWDIRNLIEKGASVSNSIKASLIILTFQVILTGMASAAIWVFVRWLIRVLV